MTVTVQNIIYSYYNRENMAILLPNIFIMCNYIIYVFHDDGQTQIYTTIYKIYQTPSENYSGYGFRRNQ